MTTHADVASAMNFSPCPRQDAKRFNSHTICMLKTTTIVNAFCSYPFQRLKVTCEGDVTMCCFQQRKCLGNILKRSLEDIWFSPLAEAIRKETIEGRLHPKCQIKSCPFFQRGNLEIKEVEQEFEAVEKKPEKIKNKVLVN